MDDPYCPCPDEGKDKKEGIKIVNRYNSDNVLFISTKDNTKDAVLEALESEANLYEASLYGADLSGAKLQNAKFYGGGGTSKLKKNQVTDFLSALGFVVEE